MKNSDRFLTVFALVASLILRTEAAIELSSNFYESSGIFSQSSLIKTPTALAGWQGFNSVTEMAESDNVLLASKEERGMHDPKKFYDQSGHSIRHDIFHWDAPSVGTRFFSGDLTIENNTKNGSPPLKSSHAQPFSPEINVITLRQNGTLDFRRSASVGYDPFTGVETQGNLVMDGGTLIHESDVDYPVAPGADPLALLSDSTLDFGSAPTFTFAESSYEDGNFDEPHSSSTWETEGVTYSGHNIYDEQPGQISFETPTSTLAAGPIEDALIPSLIVPEFSPVFALPLLGGLILYYERRRFRKKGRELD